MLLRQYQFISSYFLSSFKLACGDCLQKMCSESILTTSCLLYYSMPIEDFRGNRYEVRPANSKVLLLKQFISEKLLNKGQIVRTTDPCWNGLTQEVKTFTFLFAYWDLNFREPIKLGMHPAFLLAKIITVSKERKGEQEGSREGAGSRFPMHLENFLP